MGMSRCVGDIVDLFMWGEPDRLDIALPLAVRDHLPPVGVALRTDHRRRQEQKDDR